MLLANPELVTCCESELEVIKGMLNSDRRCFINKQNAVFASSNELNKFLIKIG